MMEKEKWVIWGSELKKVAPNSVWNLIVGAIFKLREKALEVWLPEDLFNPGWLDFICY